MSDPLAPHRPMPDPASPENATTPARKWRVDTRPLRTSRDFRLIWSSGLITYFGLLGRELLPIVAASIVSTVAVMAVVGWLQQRLEPHA